LDAVIADAQKMSVSVSCDVMVMVIFVFLCALCDFYEIFVLFRATRGVLIVRSRYYSEGFGCHGHGYYSV